MAASPGVPCVCSQPHRLYHVLCDLRPRYVVMYDPDVRSVRQLEVSGVTVGIHGNQCYSAAAAALSGVPGQPAVCPAEGLLPPLRQLRGGAGAAADPPLTVP